MKTNEEDSIKVCIRMRPLLKPYEDEEAWMVDDRTHTVMSMQGQKQESTNSYSAFVPSGGSYINEALLLAGRKDTRRKYYDNNSQFNFPFDHVAGPELKTQQIYNQIGKSITRSVLDGYNGTIFMYGQTTSGKTYTMLGTPDAPGILPCAVRDVFMEINKRKDMLFKVWISYIEIYNEVINDLLAPGVTNLKITEDPKFGVVVNGAKQQQVWSFDQAIILMNYGEESRVYRETNVHEHSSRSHTLFRVFIESQTNNIESENIIHRYSCLNLVDLAGSERLADYEGKAESMGETGYINKSLFVLANVINKLAEGKKGHIPYRDSKLTRILSQALGGNSLTAIICTISPANVNFYQTLSTLRFASRAKTVKNKPEVNELSYGLEIKEQSILQEKINKLQNELMTTREEIDRLANAKLETQISLENANEKIAQLEKENAQLKKRLEQFGLEKPGADDPFSVRSTVGTSLGNNEANEKYNSLLQEYNEEKSKRMRIETKLKEQNDESQDINLREISFMENLLWNINSIFMDSETKKQVNQENLENWFNYTENLGAQYKIEVIGLQNKFRDSLRELVQRYVPECLDEIYNYLTTINSHANTTTTEEAKNHETIQRILNKKVFESVNFNPTKILGTNDLSPSVRLNQIKEEYEKGVKKINTIYDDSRNTLEEYFRKKVNAMKIKEPQGKGAKSLKGSSPQDTNIVNITNDHQEKLNILRKLYENELKSLEKKYLETTLSLPNADSDKISNPTSILKKTDLLAERETNINEMGGFKPDLRKSTTTPIKSEKTQKSYLKFDDISGFVYLWGSGKDGRLGNGSEKSERVPKKVDSGKFRQISCGYHHNAAIDVNGRVFTWGKGVSGQLGTGSLNNEPVPVYIPLPGNLVVVQIVCGWQHTIALSQEGQVFSWGKGSDGQLGHGNSTDYSEPVKVRFFEKMSVTKIAAGHSHSAAITSTGELYMWGCNLDHRLMMQSHENQYLYNIISLLSYNLTRPSLTELASVKTGDSLEVVDVALGVSHSAVATKNGSVYTGGLGTEGQLGTFIEEDTENSIIIARKKSEDLSQAEDYQDESMEGAGQHERYCFLHNVKAFGAKNKAIKVSCGDNYTLVLTDKNILYSFGKSSHYRLGHATVKQNENVYQPKPIEALKDQKITYVSAGCRHAACVNQKGEVYGWGFNFYDQLGLGESDHDVEKPTKLVKLAGKNVKYISCGYFHTGAVVEN